MNDLIKYGGGGGGDDFDDYTSEVEGQEPSQYSGGATFLNFTNDAKWKARETVIEPNQRFMVIGVTRVVQKRGYVVDDVTSLRCQTFLKDEERVLAPNEAWPDTDAMNEKIPQAEWLRVTWSKDPQPPFIRTSMVKLVEDCAALTAYVWPANHATNSHDRAVDDLIRTIRTARKFRGAGVCPIIQLTDTFMPTRYGGRQRPQLLILEWRTPPGSGGQPALQQGGPDRSGGAVAQIEAPAATGHDAALHVTAQGAKQAPPVERKQFISASAEDAKRDAAAKQKPIESKSFIPGESVSYPTFQEEIGDKVPF
jgi:hypothetical protein